MTALAIAAGILTAIAAAWVVVTANQFLRCLLKIATELTYIRERMPK